MLVSEIGYAKNPAWLTTKRDGLIVFSTLTKARLTKELNELEEFKLCLEHLYPGLVRPRQVPTIMIIPDGEKQMDSYIPYVNDRLLSVSGLYMPNDDYKVILILGGREKSFLNRDNTFLHEYLHELTIGTEYYPAWAGEGIAEALSYFRKQGGAYTLGSGISFRRREMSYKPQDLLPLPNLFFVQTGTKEYSNPHAQPKFYNTSWLFAHYCLIEKAETLSKPFYELVEHAKNDFIRPTDFNRIFGRSLPQMTFELGRFLDSDSEKNIRISVSEIGNLKPFKIEKASSASLLAGQSIVLWRAGRLEDYSRVRKQLELIPSWNERLSKSSPELERVLELITGEVEAASN